MTQGSRCSKVALEMTFEWHRWAAKLRSRPRPRQPLAGMARRLIMTWCRGGRGCGGGSKPGSLAAWGPWLSRDSARNRHGAWVPRTRSRARLNLTWSRLTRGLTRILPGSGDWGRGPGCEWMIRLRAWAWGVPAADSVNRDRDGSIVPQAAMRPRLPRAPWRLA